MDARVNEESNPEVAEDLSVACLGEDSGRVRRTRQRAQALQPLHRDDRRHSKCGQDSVLLPALRS